MRRDYNRRTPVGRHTSGKAARRDSFRTYHKSTGVLARLVVMLIITAAMPFLLQGAYLPSAPAISLVDILPEATPQPTPVPTPGPESYTLWQQNISKDQMDRIYMTWEYRPMTLDSIPPGVNVLSPTWFYVEDRNGVATVVDLYNVSDYVYTSWDPRQYVQYAHDNGIQVWATVSCLGTPELAEQIVMDPNIQQTFISQVYDWVIRYDLDGICLDFEKMNPEHKTNYTEFARNLKNQLPDQCIVSAAVTVIVSDSGGTNWYQCYDRMGLAGAVDYIAPMLYDGHKASTMEPVAGIDWVTLHLKRLLEEIPSEQLLMGVPFYGTDYPYQIFNGDIYNKQPLWEDSGYTTTPGQLRSALANGYFTRSDKTITVDYWIDMGSWDEEISLCTYSFVDTDDVLHNIWVDDENSLYQKGLLCKRYNLAGVAVWRQGFGTEAMWNALGQGMMN